MATMSDTTSSQRFVRLLRFLCEGGIVRPGAYAQEVGTGRKAVYKQLHSLKEMGFPIRNEEHGEWTMGDLTEVVFDPYYWAQEKTANHRLAELYLALFSGRVIYVTSYAREVGIRRQAVYSQIDLLSQSGVQIINLNPGFALLEYCHERS